MTLLAFLIAAQAQKPTATVKLDAASAVVGKPLRGVLTLILPEGLHGYQNPPSGEFDIPIKLSTADAALKLSKIDYPKGESMQVAGGDKPTMVYEGTIKIPFSVIATKLPVKGSATAMFRLDYQLCNMQSCFPPGSLSIKVPLKITPKAAH